MQTRFRETEWRLILSLYRKLKPTVTLKQASWVKRRAGTSTSPPPTRALVPRSMRYMQEDVRRRAIGGTRDER